MLERRCRNSESTLVRAWLSTALVVAAGWLLAPAALADASNSANWAGYAVHRAGISFRKVSATWRQPSASCTPGRPAYSAFWVGLGGFSETSNALEQIGTETDCNAAGLPVLSAWYELVPAPSTSIRIPVRRGDAISASVTLSGHRATVSLNDLTRHRGFARTLHASLVDVSSAEWIVEAPSECVSINACATLPLADFGTATFTSAKAQGSKGHVGSISSFRWNSTRIILTPSGRRFTALQGNGENGAAAAPSTLADGGTAFSVTYSPLTIPGSPFMTARTAADRPGRLFH